MSGTPLHQAKKAIEACLGVLDEHDEFGLVTFSSGSQVFHDRLKEASAKNRQAARKFLEAVTAGGGTEMSSGLERAARMLAQKVRGPERAGSGGVLVIT